MRDCIQNLRAGCPVCSSNTSIVTLVYVPRTRDRFYTRAKATLPGTLARPTCNENNGLLTPSRSAWTSGTQFSTAPHFPTGRPSFPRDDEFNNSEYTETRVFDQQVQPATEKPGVALWNQSLYSHGDASRIIICVVRPANADWYSVAFAGRRRSAPSGRPSRE